MNRAYNSTPANRSDSHPVSTPGSPRTSTKCSMSAMGNAIRLDSAIEDPSSDTVSWVACARSAATLASRWPETSMAALIFRRRR